MGSSDGLSLFEKRGGPTNPGGEGGILKKSSLDLPCWRIISQFLVFSFSQGCGKGGWTIADLFETDYLDLLSICLKPSVLYKDIGHTC